VGQAPDAERTLAIEVPFDFDETLRFVPFGLYDPTCRRAPSFLWKAGRTPSGPVALELARTERGVVARAWGQGAAWALERAPALLGLGDDPGAFQPRPGQLATLARRGRALRLSRSPWVFDGLCESILQQRVSFRDAARSHRRLVGSIGEPAPGPHGLRLPLSPRDWLSLTEPGWRRAGVDGQRARALRAAARAARAVDASFGREASAARATLAAIPGCGAWTVELTMGFVLGDPDAVPLGDLHLPTQVAWALAGERHADDARMLELLEPYRGHRFRLLRLLLAAGRLHLGRRPGA
jgi:3-methyladenine DNA glycosylase/8-oxoguanine DNA glycosylase